MLVLASASPRRRELLALLGLPFLVEPSRYEEPPPPTHPVVLSTLVEYLASQKALEVAARLSDASHIIIGADTLVTTSESELGIPFGKPKNAEDAVRMLRALSGKTHYVYTGIALAQCSDVDSSPKVAAVCNVRTGVTFRQLSIEMIEDYVGTNEPMDKAGAYGAQGYGAPFISEFLGDFYNVVGLPLCSLGILLESIGITWWRHRTEMDPVIG